jgi:hypothetical protein
MERAKVEGVKNQIPRRETCCMLIFLMHPFGQFHKIGLVKFQPKIRLPTFFNLYHHALFIV